MPTNSNFLIYILIGGGLFQGLFIIALLISQKEGKKSNRILAIIILICSVNLIHPYLFLFFEGLGISGNVRLIEPAQFLIAPLLAFYIQSLLFSKNNKTLARNRSDNSKNRRFTSSILRPLTFYAPHFIPSVLASVIAMIIEIPDYQSFLPTPWASIGLWGFLILQAGAYLFYSLRQIRSFETKAKDAFSNKADIDIGFVRWIFHIFVFLYAVYGIILMLLIHSPTLSSARTILTFVFMVIIWILGYLRLAKKRGRSLADYENILKSDSENKYSRSGITEEFTVMLEKRLIDLMVKEELFKDSELCLDDLVDHSGSSRNDVSSDISRLISRPI